MTRLLALAVLYALGLGLVLHAVAGHAMRARRPVPCVQPPGKTYCCPPAEALELDALDTDGCPAGDWGFEAPHDESAVPARWIICAQIVRLCR